MEAAPLLGVNEFTLGNWERGKTEPKLRYLPRVYAFLGEDPEPAGKELPERLRAYRRRHGLSRRALARRVGLDPETLGRYERGLRVPAGQIRERLEGLLRTDK